MHVLLVLLRRTRRSCGLALLVFLAQRAAAGLAVLALISWLDCATFVPMRRLRRIVLSLFVSLAFLASTLAVCNAHLSAAEHPDCPRCLMISTSRRENGAPAHLPAGPHHCPDHACAHLHAPFMVDSGMELTPPVASWFFLTSPHTHGRELSRALLKPPRA